MRLRLFYLLAYTMALLDPVNLDCHRNHKIDFFSIGSILIETLRIAYIILMNSYMMMNIRFLEDMHILHLLIVSNAVVRAL
jgi:hypothetical protein